MKLYLGKFKEGDIVHLKIDSETVVEIQVKHCGRNAVKLAVLRRPDLTLHHQKSQKRLEGGAKGA